MTQKLILGTCLALLMGCQKHESESHTSSSWQQCLHPWVYFDLGETLIHTDENKDISFKKRALAYLTSLHDKGFPIGLLTNVPDEWGANPEEKLAYLKIFTAATWQDTVPFPWHWFEGRTHVSHDAERRKPHPHLFQLALAQASNENCPALFQGETVEEVRAAEGVGLKGYVVGRENNPFYLPEHEIDQILTNP